MTTELPPIVIEQPPKPARREEWRAVLVRDVGTGDLDDLNSEDGWLSSRTEDNWRRLTFGDLVALVNALPDSEREHLRVAAAFGGFYSQKATEALVEDSENLQARHGQLAEILSMDRDPDTGKPDPAPWADLLEEAKCNIREIDGLANKLASLANYEAFEQTYSGGHSDPDKLAAFQHGMWTVCAAAKAVLVSSAAAEIDPPIQPGESIVRDDPVVPTHASGPDRLAELERRVSALEQRGCWTGGAQ